MSASGRPLTGFARPGTNRPTSSWPGADPHELSYQRRRKGEEKEQNKERREKVKNKRKEEKKREEKAKIHKSVVIYIATARGSIALT